MEAHSKTNLESDWMNPLAITIKVGQLDFLLPVEPVGKGSSWYTGALW